MATKKSQRIGIWVIAIAMLVGTLGGFLVMVLAPKNQAADQARFEELSAAYEQATAQHQERVAQKLSEQYYDTVKSYESHVSPFDADAVDSLETTDLKEGDGEELTSESSFTAYYIGWNPDGTVFDSSLSGDTLDMPLEVMPGAVIEGWTKGVDGMNVGGARELTIPADLAYGEAGRGEYIPPNTPLKFVVFVIPEPDTEPAPTMPDELKRLYTKLYNIDPSIFEGGF